MTMNHVHELSITIVNSKPKHFSSWSYGLLFHQGLVDLARSAILIPLGKLSFSVVKATPQLQMSIH